MLRKRFFVPFVLVAVSILAASNAVAQESTYILTADSWGLAQATAVAQAGGKVIFSHAKTGIGVAASSAPDFLSRAVASGKFGHVGMDMAVQWVKPDPETPQFDVSPTAVTPGDETFINLQWNIKAMDVPAAWAATGLTGNGVRVAVIDGGLYNSHIDLTGNVDVARSISFVPGFAFNQDVGTFWHATHVAGIIAAKDNAIGTIGVAPKATIIGVKALHDGSGTFAAVIEGILYSATPISENGAGADIINMSLGAVFPRGGGNTGAGPLIAAINKAVNFATSQNVLVISAAGNDGLDMDHTGSLISVPAMSGSGIAISATGPVGFAVNYPNGATNLRRPASYTNYGVSIVNLAAPGGDFALPGNALCSVPRVPTGSVTTPCWVFDMVMSTVRGSSASSSSYGFAAGTSMAAPAAAGVAALVKERIPMISVDGLKAILAQTADDEGKKGRDPYYGAGFVNAYRAVTR